MKQFGRRLEEVSSQRERRRTSRVPQLPPRMPTNAALRLRLRAKVMEQLDSAPSPRCRPMFCAPSWSL